MKTKPHHPTKLCPHRWCRRAHWTGLALVLAADMMYGMPGPVVAIAVLLVAIPLTGAVLTYLFAKDPAMTAPVRTMLRVNRRWANAALAVDIALVLSAAQSLLDAAIHYGEHLPDAVVLSRIGGPRTLIMFAAVATWVYTHRRATRPGRPRRVRLRRLVPIPVKTQP